MTNHWLDIRKVKTTDLSTFEGDHSRLKVFPFVENERIDQYAMTSLWCYHFYLKYTPILPGSLTGTLYCNQTAVQKFTAMNAGLITFFDIPGITPKARGSGSISAIN